MSTNVSHNVFVLTRDDLARQVRDGHTRGVTEERERCAKIAEGHGDVGKRVAKKIRNNPPTL